MRHVRVGLLAKGPVGLARSRTLSGMDVQALIARLEPLPSVLEALLLGLRSADWTWRPADGGWSILEIVTHLLAEEVHDFRVRTRSTLEDPPSVSG